MRTATYLVALFALLSLASAQTPVCSPVLACSAALSAVNVPSPFYALNFSTDPRPSAATAAYGWLATGANETGCASSPFHQGVVQLIGATHDTSTLGPYVNLSAPVSDPSSVATPLPVILFGTGTSLGNVTAGTAGWSVEVVFKAYAQTAWAKVFDIGAGFGGGHYDVLMGWNGGNNYMAWTADAAVNGGSDIEYVINQLVFNQWYHAVLVWQETAAGAANWISYINGVQTQSLANAYFPPAVLRPSANLGRSNWADQYFQGEIDTFNIYQWALSPLQALALASKGMGGCAVTYATTAALSVPLNAAAPAPLFEATFGSDPRGSAGGAAAANYGWVSQDADDASCGLSQHQGLLQLSGQYANGNPVGGYVNLSANTGVDSIGQVLPTIGGPSAATANTDAYGWSFEVVFKAELAYPNAKIFDIAAPQNNSQCSYDILFGIYANPVQNGVTANQPTLQFDICDGAGNQYAFNGWGPIQLGTWYHVVMTVSQLPYQTKAMYTTYINGVRAGLLGNVYYPEAVVRANADLGKSSWADSYFGGLVDTFRVYNFALNPAQVISLSSAALGANATLRCPQVTTGLSSVVPSDALIHSLNFNSDPRTAAGGASNALYNWVQVDPLDSAADQLVHTGLIVLNGFANSTYAAGSGLGPYVNLSAPTGPASVGAVLPLIGTDTAGLWSQGSVGFTLELSVKMRSQTSWAKVFDLGAARGAPGGNCNGDLVFGWVGSSNLLEFETCTDASSGSNRLTILPTAALNTWYHIVVVVQQTYSNLAIAYGYVNGQAVGNMTLAYPFAEYRRDATLGHSDWNDAYINATYDLFNVYNQALNPQQVLRQYGYAFNVNVGLPAPSSSSSSSSSSTAAAASSSSSSAAAAQSSSAAVQVTSSSTAAPVVNPSTASVTQSSSAATASSSTAAGAAASSSSAPFSSAAASPSSSSGTAAAATGDSSSSSSSTGSSTIISTGGAASTVASAAVMVLCALASLALML